MAGGGEKIIFQADDNNSIKTELSHEEIWDDTLLIQHYDDSMARARLQLAGKLSSASSMTESDCSNSHRTELINGFTHSKLHNSNINKKKKKKKGRKKNEWHIGDHCRAHYSEDGSIYEATIIGINNTTGTCTVRYLGYNNYEDVAQSSLLKSKGENTRKKQMKEVSETLDHTDETNEESCSIDESDAQSEVEHPSARGNRHFPGKMPPPQRPFMSNRHNKPESAGPSIPYLPHLQPPPALGLVDGPDPISSEALHTMLMSWYMTGYHTGYYQGINDGKNIHYNRSSNMKKSYSKNNQ